MGFMPMLSVVMAAGVFAMGSTASSAADLPGVTVVSLQVKPLIATSAAGKALFLQVHWEGPGTLGKDTRLSVAGAPEGTTLDVSPMTEQDAVVGLAFPTGLPRGRYLVSLGIGSPEPLVTQQIEVEIGE